MGNQTVVYPNGDKYKGDIKDGKKNGRGVYTFISGNKYEGDYKDDQMDGRGRFYLRMIENMKGILKQEKWKEKEHLLLKME